MVYRYRVGGGKGCVGVDGSVNKDGTRVGRPTHSLPSEWVWSRGSFEEQPAQQSADSLCQALFDGHLAKTIWTSWPALQIVLYSVSDTISDSVSGQRESKKWQVALVKLDPLIWGQVEKGSARWYSLKYRLVFGGTGSVEGTTCWYLEELGQY